MHTALCRIDLLFGAHENLDPDTDIVSSTFGSSETSLENPSEIAIVESLA